MTHLQPADYVQATEVPGGGQHVMNDQSIENLTPQQLRRAAALMERIQSLEKELKKLLAVKPAAAAPERKKRKRKMSAAAKAKMSKAAKKRWAKAKAAGKKRL